MTNRSSLPLLVGLLAAVLGVLSLAPTAAAAQKPCWERLIDDWYDGRIDGTYSVRCYREAQRRVPEDARVYSSLPEDLERALQSALVGGGGPPSPDTLIPPVPGTGRDISAAGGSGEEAGGGTVLDGEDNKSSPFLDKFRPSNADSIPIPLLVLAALAMLLLAAAAASFVARRLQARREPITPRPRTPRP